MRNLLLATAAGAALLIGTGTSYAQDVTHNIYAPMVAYKTGPCTVIQVSEGGNDNFYAIDVSTGGGAVNSNAVLQAYHARSNPFSFKTGRLGVLSCNVPGQNVPQDNIPQLYQFTEGLVPTP